MAALTDTTIASTYKQLLKITSEGVGADASAKYVEDGLGTDTALSLSTTRVGIGTASPDSLLHAKVTTNSSETIRLQNDDTLSTLGVSSDGYSFLTYQTALHIVPWDASTWGGTKIIVDANGKVGIGTDSPDELLHIESSSSYKPVLQIENTNTNAIPGYLKFYKNSTSPADDDYLGVLIFRGNTDNGSGAVSSSDVEFASIQVIADDTGNSSKSSKMFFKTFTSNTESTNMVIGKDGNVGIGTESPSSLLYLEEDNTTNVTDAASMISNSSLTINGNSSDGSDVIRMGAMSNATGDYFIEVSNAAGNAAYNLLLNPINGGRVGIGTTSPESQLTFNTVAYTSSADYGIRVQNPDTTADAVIQHYENSDLVDWYIGSNAYVNTSGAQVRYNTSKESAAINISAANGHIFFATSGTGANPSSRMLINSNGNVLIGTSSLPSNSNAGFCITGTNSGNTSSSGSSTSAWNHLMFYNGNGNVGYISTSSSATTYSTSSDYRLKENEVLISDGLTRVNQLKPYRFNFKADKDTTVDGFFAHEVSDIVPEAITGEKDAVDDDGNIVSQGIDQSKLVPLLVKAVQELLAKVEDLETELKTELQDTKDYVDHKQDYNSMAGRINSCEARIGHLEKK